jgi:hypothetical protein
MALALFALRHDVLFVGGSAVLWPFAEKARLGPLRIMNFAALALLFGQKVLWPPGAVWVRSLGYLGRNSLQVFSSNILCVYGLGALFGPWQERSAWLQIVTVLLGLATLPLAAWLHETRKRLTTKHAKEDGP